MYKKKNKKLTKFLGKQCFCRTYKTEKAIEFCQFFFSDKLSFLDTFLSKSSDKVTT